jgi:hypothetical protein
MRLSDTHRALAFALIALSTLSRAAAAADDCFCLENFDEARFLYNCRIKTPSTPDTALCRSPKNGITEIVMSAKWTRLAPLLNKQCPKDCLPRSASDPDTLRGD